MKNFIYPAKIKQDKSGFWLVTFPDIPYAATDGETKDEAIENASDCLAEALATMMIHDEEIPKPSKPKNIKVAVRIMVAVPIDISFKIALYDIAREQGYGSSALGRELGIDEKSARRMLDPHYNTTLKSMINALNHFGKKPVLSFQ